MNQKEQIRIYEQLSWDYNISPEDIESVIKGEKEGIGHFTRETLFIRMLETYPWFTILKLFTVEEVQKLLTVRVVSRLRSPSLRKNMNLSGIDYSRLYQLQDKVLSWFHESGFPFYLTGGTALGLFARQSGK